MYQCSKVHPRSRGEYKSGSQHKTIKQGSPPLTRGILSAEGLCCEILARYEDVLTDPQAIANDFVYKMKYDNGQEATLVRTCLRSERMGTPEFNRGPMLGEHTVSILKEAGYSDEEIEKYLSEGIIRQHD